MEPDARAFPNRLARQVALLQTHSNYAAVGSWAAYIDRQGRCLAQDWRPPTSPGMIRWTLCFEPCLPPGSVVMRRQNIERIGGYPPEAEHAEDYDLWLRMLNAGELAGVPEVLLQLRSDDPARPSPYNEPPAPQEIRLARDHITQVLERPVSFSVTQGLYDLHHRRPSAAEPEAIRATLIDLLHAHITDRPLPESDEVLIRFDAAKKLAQLARDILLKDPKTAVKALSDTQRIAPWATRYLAGHRLLERLTRPPRTRPVGIPHQK